MGTLRLNGKDYEINQSQTVSELVAKNGGDAFGVAVAVNGQVVTRREWESTLIKDGDEVRLVRAVAGGASDNTLLDPKPLVIAGKSFHSRLFVGTGRYVSPAVMRESLEAAGTEMVTVAIRATGLDG
ncbi:MAG TPA: sulfur carrier protein ThiS, partial [Chloroflexota bacterium]|nr:sulfur carrier protein ThiS [Chloroflexota bacterium]